MRKSIIMFALATVAAAIAGTIGGCLPEETEQKLNTLLDAALERVTNNGSASASHSPMAIKTRATPPASKTTTLAVCAANPLQAVVIEFTVKMTITRARVTTALHPNDSASVFEQVSTSFTLEPGEVYRIRLSLDNSSGRTTYLLRVADENGTWVGEALQVIIDTTGNSSASVLDLHDPAAVFAIHNVYSE